MTYTDKASFVSWPPCTHIRAHSFIWCMYSSFVCMYVSSYVCMCILRLICMYVYSPTHMYVCVFSDSYVYPFSSPPYTHIRAHSLRHPVHIFVHNLFIRRMYSSYVCICWSKETGGFLFTMFPHQEGTPPGGGFPPGGVFYLLCSLIKNRV